MVAAAASKGSKPAFSVRSMQGRGRGLVASRRLGGSEQILQEEALLSVRTTMLLSGVVVLRRGKVEALYAELGASEQQRYRVLHPVCEDCEEGEKHEQPMATAPGSLRRRTEPVPAESVPSEAAPTEEKSEKLTTKQHREIWDQCAFNYTDSSDVKKNRVLHLLIFPALLSVITGCLWAHWFHAPHIRSILGACVLFFGMLGPVCLRVVYLGSQALFPTAALLNHSCCFPNCVWEVEGCVSPMESPGGGDSSGSVSGPARLVLKTKQPVSEGQELLIDYIPELAHLEGSERRNLLQQEYGFLCDCARCLAGDKEQAVTRPAPTEEEEEET